MCASSRPHPPAHSFSALSAAAAADAQPATTCPHSSGNRIPAHKVSRPAAAHSAHSRWSEGAGALSQVGETSSAFESPFPLPPRSPSRSPHHPPPAPAPCAKVRPRPCGGFDPLPASLSLLSVGTANNGRQMAHCQLPRAPPFLPSLSLSLFSSPPPHSLYHGHWLQRRVHRPRKSPPLSLPLMPYRKSAVVMRQRRRTPSRCASFITSAAAARFPALFPRVRLCRCAHSAPWPRVSPAPACARVVARPVALWRGLKVLLQRRSPSPSLSLCPAAGDQRRVQLAGLWRPLLRRVHLGRRHGH